MYMIADFVDDLAAEILPLDKFPVNQPHRETFHIITVGNPRVRTADAVIRIAELIASKSEEGIKTMLWEEVSPLLNAPYYNRSCCDVYH